MSNWYTEMATNRKTQLYLALVLAIAVAGPASAQQEYVAIITELQGTAEVAPAHAPQYERAVWGMHLFEGDRVRTQIDSKISLLFANSNLIELGPNSSLSISGGNRTTPSSPSIAGALGQDLADAVAALTLRRKSDGGLAALGDLRSGGPNSPVVAIAPRNTLVGSVRPAFAWQAQQDFEGYVVKLFDGSGLVWRRESEGNRLEYPADEAPLNPGSQYFWQVQGRALLDVEASERVGFRTLDDESRAMIVEREAGLRRSFDPTGSNFEFLMGAFYAKEGLAGAAIASFEEIAARHPDAIFPRELLATLYDEVGLTNAARAHRQRAAELSRQ